MSSEPGQRAPTPSDQWCGQLLRRIRLARQMSMAQIGDLIGVSASQISKYELGQDRVSAGNLLDVCRALGEPLEEHWQAFAAEAETPAVRLPRVTMRLVELAASLGERRRTALMQVARALAGAPADATEEAADAAV